MSVRVVLVLAWLPLAAACSGAPRPGPTPITAAPTANAPPTAPPTAPAATAPVPTTTEPSVVDLEPSGPFGVARAELLGPDGERVDLDVYVAETAEQRGRGLMNVEDLPEGVGMVFLFENDTTSGFVMRDTLIPLTVAFFAADGVLLTTLDMQPCTAEPCEVYDPGVSYRSALEVNQGALEAAGVEAGWRIEIEG